MCNLLMPSDFQLLFEATPHPYLILRPDAAFTIVAVNDRYLAATGTQRTNIVGHAVFEIFPDNPEDSSGGGVSDLRASLNRVVADRLPDVMGVQKYDIPLRDGSGEFEVRYWSPVNTPVFGPTGELLLIIHHVEDITEFILSRERASQESAEKILRIEARAERSEAEVLLRAAELKEANRALKAAKEELKRRTDEQLRQSEEQYRALVQASSQALYRMSPDWSELRQLQGGGFIADTEKPNRNWLQVYIPPDDQQCLMAKIGEAIRTEAMFEFEHQVRRVDGSLGWAHSRAVPVRDGAGKIVEWFGAASDITKRKLAEEQLRASEEKYRTLFANMSEAFALGEPIFDDRGRSIDYRFLDVNDAFYEQTGLPRGIEGRPLREALPQLEQIWTDHYAAAAFNGQSARIESYNADTHRYYDTYCFCPSPGRFAILFRDITERKKAEQALLDSKQTLAMALRAGGSAAWELDVVKGKMVPVDEMLYTMVGYAAEELDEPADWISRIHEEDKAAVTRNLTDTIEGQAEAYWQELRFRKKDGHWLWLLSQGVAVERDAEGRAIRLIGTNTDIDARKRMEERLKESEASLRELIATLPGMVWTTTTDGAIDFISQRWYDYTGTTVETQLGVGAFECIHPADWGNVLEAWQTAVAKKAVYDIEYRLRRHDGIYRWFKARGTPVLDAYNQVARWLGVLIDIDDLKRTEDEIQRLNNELEQRVEERTAELQAANRELEGFTFATSHDLRGPLGRISSFSTLLEQHYRDRLEGEGLLFLNFIRDNAKRLNLLIDDLLIHARVAQQKLDLQPMDVNEVVGAVLSEKAAEIDQAGARVKLVLPATKVQADSYLLIQAVDNLLQNSLKYRDPDRVLVIEIGGREEQERAIVWVKDNGIGFDMAYRDKIFEMFQRLHSHGDIQGSGIGLALVQRAVERMGGKVWAESEPNKGATFYLELQMAAEKGGA